MIFNMKAKEVLGVIESDSTKLVGSYDSVLKINEIGGECEQETTNGKNLIPISEYTTNASGDTAKYMSIPKLVQGKSYIVSAKTLDGIVVTGGNCQLLWYDADGNIIFNSINTWFTNGFAFNSDLSNATKFAIYTASAIAGKTIQIQLEEGKVATAYEPYTGGKPAPNLDYPMEIKKSVVSGIKTHWKNLLNMNTEPYLANHLVNGSFGFYKDDECDVYRIDKPKNSEIYFKVGKTGANISVGFYRSDGTLIYVEKYADRNSFSINHTSSADYLLVTTIKGENAFMVSYEDIPYEPYTESVVTFSQPIALAGMNGVRDLLTANGVIRHFGVINVGNTSSMTYNSGNNTLVIEAFKGVIKNAPNDDTAGNVLCEKLMAVAFNELYKKEGVSVSSTGVISLKANSLNSLEEWKTYLTNNPISLLCEMSTPTLYELSEVDRLAIDINSLQTFNGVTYVEFDTEVQPTFNCDYATSPVGAVALAVNAYNEIEKNFVSYNHEDGSANFTGNINGNAYIYGKNIQARQAVFAEMVKTWYDVEAQGNVKATKNVEATEYVVGKNLQAEQMVFAQAVEASMNLISKGGITGVDLNITNLGINGGAPQPVEWVWDSALSRWVLCSTETQG